jgi:hypothetical protein
MQLGSVTVRRARKRHECWWCSEWIESGEHYAKWVWKDGGDLLPVKVHLECRTAWAEIGDEGVGFGDFCRGCTCERGCCECAKGTK